MGPVAQLEVRQICNHNLAIKTSSVIFSLLLIRIGQLVDQLTALYDFNSVAMAWN